MNPAANPDLTLQRSAAPELHSATTVVARFDAATTKRLSELDGIRGLAVLMVMCGHAFFTYMGAEGWSGIPRLISTVTRFGWLGVDLFFVLSGFLITGILLDSKTHPHYWRNFYVRRALRILPLYLVTLLLVLIFYADAGRFVLLSLFFLANVTQIFGVPMIYGPLWSLAVEEHFYLLWPWLVRFTTARTLAVIAALIVIAEPIVRAIGFGLGVQDTYFYSWFRFDGLAWGALLAIFFRHPACAPKSLWRLALLGLMAGLLLFIGGLPLGIHTRHQIVGAALQFSAAQLIFVGLIAAALAAPGTWLAPVFNWRPLRRCGDLSYCLYLLNLLLLEAWDKALLRLDWQAEQVVGRFGSVLLRAAVALTAAFVLAELSFRYFETPLLRLKRFFS